MNVQRELRGEFGIQALQSYVPPELYTAEDLLRLDRSEFSLDKMMSVWTETAFEPANLYEFLMRQTTGSARDVASPRADDASILARKSGIALVPCASKESASDMAVGVGRQILNEYRDGPAGIDLLIYYHSALNEKPTWSTSCRLKHELDLNKALAVSISQKGGNSVMAALKVARDMMAAERNLKTALLIGSEKVIPPSRRAFGNLTLIGDSATAMIVAASWDSQRMIDSEIRDFPEWWNPYEYSAERLNGLEEFLAARSMELIRTLMTRQHLGWSDIKRLLPPNFSLSFARRLGGQSAIPLNRIYTKNIGRFGYLLTSDFVINLDSAMSEGEVERGDLVISLCLGLGLSLGACLIEI